MFQACDVKIAKTDAASTPSMLCGKSVSHRLSVTDKKPRTGTDCSTSRTGNSTFSARRSRAAAVAYTRVKTVDTASAANIRSSDLAA